MHLIPGNSLKMIIITVFLDEETKRKRAKVPYLWFTLRNWSPFSWSFHSTFSLAVTFPVKVNPNFFLSRDEALSVLELKLPIRMHISTH